ncbi:MAG: ATP-grasp domain-containing protein [Nocardioidaceae bacterium]
MLRIWFNRTYATHFHTLDLIRANPDRRPVHLIGTHADPDSPVLSTCDESAPEPDHSLTGADYVGWALTFCEEHRVDVFVPRWQQGPIAAARDSFSAAGVALVSASAEAIAAVGDKANAYAHAAAAGLPVPPWRVATDAQSFVKAHAELAAEVGDVCVKPVNGVGGDGFRVLRQQPLKLADFLTGPTSLQRADALAAALREAESEGRPIPPLLLMPYLPGPEVSVDCLATSDGELLVAVPRTKIGRRRELRDDPDAVAVARALVVRHRLGYLSNTQVRGWAHPGRDESPRAYLLETNPRMSAGLAQTSLAGVNLPWSAVKLALGERVDVPEPRLGKAFTTVPAIVVLPDLNEGH